MTDDEFKIIFEHLEKGIEEQIKLQSKEISEVMELNEEIKTLSEIISEIISDSTPKDEPLLYSSS